MAFFMVTNKWPLSASEDASKVFMKGMGVSKPFPDYFKRDEYYIATGEDDGLKSYSLFECEDEHLSEGLNLVAENLAEYRVVPGYTYNIEILMGAADAVGILGLKL